MGFQSERLLTCFHERQKRHGNNWACSFSNTIVSATDRIDCSIIFRPSHFKDCVAMATCLIVALSSSFLIEVCWLFHCVVYSQCKIEQLKKQDNRKCIFATDRILEQNSVRRTFKCFGVFVECNGCLSM